MILIIPITINFIYCQMIIIIKQNSQLSINKLIIIIKYSLIVLLIIILLLIIIRTIINK